MPEVHRSRTTLCFYGDDLDPETISQGLGVLPTSGRRKNGIWRTPSGTERVAQTGSWLLRSEPAKPADLDGQIMALFAPLSSDLEIWRGFAARYRARLFVGLFLVGLNEGLSVSSDTLLAVASRGLVLDLDIYSGEDRDTD